VALIEGKAWATAALGRRMTMTESKEFAEELKQSKEEDLAVIEEFEDADAELLIMDGKGEYCLSIHDRARRRWVKRKQREQERAAKRVRFGNETRGEAMSSSTMIPPATNEADEAVTASPVDAAPPRRAENAISGTTSSCSKPTEAPAEASRQCSRSSGRSSAVECVTRGKHRAWLLVIVQLKIEAAPMPLYRSLWLRMLITSQQPLQRKLTTIGTLTRTPIRRVIPKTMTAQRAAGLQTHRSTGILKTQE
jgi:hypothetical protein